MTIQSTQLPDVEDYISLRSHTPVHIALRLYRFDLHVYTLSSLSKYRFLIISNRLSSLNA